MTNEPMTPAQAAESLYKSDSTPDFRGDDGRLRH